jgi:mRNA interferase RelE/StbE
MRARGRFYVPDIPPHVADVIRSLPPEIKSSVRAAIRALCVDPGAGEPMQRELTGLWKYRVRRYRIVYTIDRSTKTLRLFAVGHRRSIYEELARERGAPDT